MGRRNMQEIEEAKKRSKEYTGFNVVDQVQGTIGLRRASARSADDLEWSIRSARISSQRWRLPRNTQEDTPGACNALSYVPSGAAYIFGETRTYVLRIYLCSSQPSISSIFDLNIARPLELLL
uniref:Uncharacterized protein n=1 Tax=Ananas comosus var. bracteatus TaxID=296719 RepID=A0A6V7NQR4_ANACO|nr:unnamed protein product [Ananas comosus var. bracteatus]